MIDADNYRIQKFDSDGKYLTKLVDSGSGDGEFNSPLGIAVDTLGTCMWQYADNHRIQKFHTTENGITYSYLKQWGTRASNYLEPQSSVAVHDGFIFVADSDNNRILKFDQSGNMVTRWGIKRGGEMGGV